jgi:hypothetical protein
VGAATVRSLSLLAELIYGAPASHRDPCGRGLSASAPIGNDPASADPPKQTAQRQSEGGRAPRDEPVEGGSPLPQAAPPSLRRRWADYSYAHGGKDGHPFPVDRKTYDRDIDVLLDAVRRARLGDPEKTDALRRLARCGGPS